MREGFKEWRAFHHTREKKRKKQVVEMQECKKQKNRK